MTSHPISLPLADGERHEQRDDIGRLVGLTFHHGATSAAETPRILIAVDGTDVSDALMEQVIDWQQRFNWRFDAHLLTVRDFLGKEAAERLLEETALADCASVLQRLKAANVAHTLHVLMGDPAPRILERAAAIGAAMILMGTRGHGPISSAMLGSVAYKVVHASTIPVTLVRA
ncbi:MAG TPA: universal stress protein [Xanthomonadales bacterium]|nr:universal stress protein [Xanthomonadales bacterium]